MGVFLSKGGRLIIKQIMASCTQYGSFNKTKRWMVILSEYTRFQRRLIFLFICSWSVSTPHRDDFSLQLLCVYGLKLSLSYLLFRKTVGTWVSILL